MQTSSRWFILVAMVGLAGALGIVVRMANDPAPPSTAVSSSTGPSDIVGLPDGTWFAMVGVDGAADPPQLMIDPAEMLTGEKARLAAVAAGAIGPGDVLPNDFFISNPHASVVRRELAENVVIVVLSGSNPSYKLVIAVEDLVGLANGSYVGPPVYGIVPGIPIAMNLTVAHGLVIHAEAVYLP